VAESASRDTVDLSAYPDLVVIHLGMGVEEPRGVETLQALGPQIEAAVAKGPDGLLLHERLFAPTRHATGPMLGARARVGADRKAESPPS
jgi:hypothetical protein